MRPHGTRRIIINADDLGLNSRVNEETFALMEAGLVTSASILANGAAFRDAVGRAGNHPGCSFGVHLNLTAGRPLNPSRGLRPLLDADGNLRQLASYHRLSPSTVEAACRELMAQVAAVRAAGIRVSHLDSHQFVHTQPRLFWMLKRIQSTFGIRRVRLSKNIHPPGGDHPSPFLLQRKALWNCALRRFYRTVTTRGFTDFATFRQVVGRLPLPESIELMVHPGNERFSAETALLRAWEPERSPIPVRLISYHDLEVP